MVLLVFEETLLGFEISHLFLQVCSILQVDLGSIFQQKFSKSFNEEYWSLFLTKLPPALYLLLNTKGCYAMVRGKASFSYNIWNKEPGDIILWTPWRLKFSEGIILFMIFSFYSYKFQPGSFIQLLQ